MTAPLKMTTPFKMTKPCQTTTPLKITRLRQTTMPPFSRMTVMLLLLLAVAGVDSDGQAQTRYLDR